MRFSSFAADVRFAIRTWVKNPGYAAVSLITLALGIGANTTMFSVINATVLRSLPFPEPDRLMTLWKGRTDNPNSLGITSWPNFRDWKERSRSFEQLALFDSAGRGYNLTGPGEPEQVSGVRATASFFDVLGIPPALGRTFTEDEEQPGRDDVVVISHGLWTRRFGADPSIVGKAIVINDRPHTVVGVMPPEFRFQFWSGLRELWVPAGWTEGDASRSSNSFVAIGRLKRGVSVAQAQAEMDVIGRALAEEYPEDNTGSTVRLVPMAEYGMAERRQALFTMLGVVGFVLLIACVNVANLSMARAASRQRELTIRYTLGADRWRLVRQLLTESVLMALLGGAAGVLLAMWGTASLMDVLPDALLAVPLRPVNAIPVDKEVLVFTLAISCLTGVIFGLFPAFTAVRRNVNDPLKTGSRGSTGAKSRLRYALVASEIALALITVAGAGVMIVSLSRLLRVDPGLDPSNVLVMQMSLPQANLYYGPPDNVRFCADLEQHVGAIPGVLSVSAIAHLPLSGANAGRTVAVEGRPDPGPGKRPGGAYTVACPGVLRTLGIPLVVGREFTSSDTVGAPGVVIMNEAMAKQLWPDEEAVGKRLKLGGLDADEPWLTVVGVFRNVRNRALDREVEPWVMRPYSQAGWPVLSIVAKTASAPAAFVGPVKKALTIVEPTQPVSGIRTMEEVVGRSVSSRRFLMILLSTFAALALVLAAVGITGVVGYSVVQRTQEIGVRMALGAQPGDVLRLVIGHSMAWTLAGVVAGVASAAGLLRLLRAGLYGVEPADPTVLAVVSGLLVAVALIATYLPARRASRVDPLVTLRSE